MIIEKNTALCLPSENFTFSVISAGNAFCDHNWQATEITPSYTRVYYIVSGRAKIETAQGPQDLVAGNLYVLPTGISFSYSCNDKMQQLYFHITLTNTYGADILRGIHTVLSKKVSGAHIESLLKLFNEDSIVSRGFLKALLHTDIFSLLQDNHIQVQNNHLSEPIQKAKLFIEEHLSASITTETICAQLSISPTTLSRKFRAEMGIPIGKYIDGLVMRQAESMLINTDLPLSVISERLGFYDQFYFSRRFKEKYSLPPLKYRKLHQP